MFNKVFSSIKANVNQKTTNPFLGTFIIIWIIHNWKFVYSLFSFDADLNLSQRIKKIESYFESYDYWNILETIGYAFLVLVGTYLLLNLSRLIINFFDKVVTPVIYKVTDKTSVVMRTEHDKVVNQVSELELKIQGERRLRLETQSEYDKLEADYKKLLSDRSAPAVEQKKSDVFGTTTQGLAEKIIEILDSRKLRKAFLLDASDILNHKTILDNEGTRFFVTLGLFEAKATGGITTGINYTLTPLGKEVHQKLLF